MTRSHQSQRAGVRGLATLSLSRRRLLRGALALAAAAPSVALLEACGGPTPAGSNTAVVTSSGSGGVTTAPASASSAVKGAVELRAGSSDPKGSHTANALEKFAELVNQKSNGTLIVHHFYTALGVETQLTQEVMNGSVDIGMISNGNAARYSNAFFVYDLPFLFKEYDDMIKSLSGPIAQKLFAQFEKDLGVKMVFPIHVGSGRDIQTTKKPLKSPADIKGLKIRVISSPVDLATFKAWGANPTPVDWGQTYSALQQGVVDGLQVPSGVIYTNKLYEVVKYSLQINYQALFSNLFINAKKFDSLSADHQKVFVQAADEARTWDHQTAGANEQKFLAELAKSGVQLYKPTPDEYAQWASIREKVWQEVADELKGKLDLGVAEQLRQG